MARKSPQAEKSYMLIEVGLMCTAMVRIRGHGRESNNCYTMKCSLASNFALRIRNQVSDGKLEQDT